MAKFQTISSAVDSVFHHSVFYESTLIETIRAKGFTDAELTRLIVCILACRDNGGVKVKPGMAPNGPAPGDMIDSTAEPSTVDSLVPALDDGDSGLKGWSKAPAPEKSPVTGLALKPGESNRVKLKGFGKAPELETANESLAGW